MPDSKCERCGANTFYEERYRCLAGVVEAALCAKCLREWDVWILALPEWEALQAADAALNAVVWAGSPLAGEQAVFVIARKRAMQKAVLAWLAAKPSEATT